MHTTGTSNQTLSWSISTVPSSRRCPTEKAMPKARAARSQQTAREGEEPTGGESPGPSRRHRSLGQLKAAPGRRLLSWGSTNCLCLSPRSPAGEKPSSQRPQPSVTPDPILFRAQLMSLGTGALRNTCEGAWLTHFCPPQDPPRLHCNPP